MNDYRGQPSVDDGQQHDDDTSPATPHLGMPPSHIFYVNPYSKISLYSFHVYMDTRNGPSRELVRFAGRFEASSRAPPKQNRPTDRHRRARARAPSPSAKCCSVDSTY